MSDNLLKTTELNGKTNEIKDQKKIEEKCIDNKLIDQKCVDNKGLKSNIQVTADISDLGKEKFSSTDDAHSNLQIRKYVILASGNNLSSSIIEQIKNEVIKLFDNNDLNIDNLKLDSDERIFISTMENNVPALLLRWNVQWGCPPSKFMDIKRLKLFLRCFKFSTGPYIHEERKKLFLINQKESGFSEKEKAWALEVFQIPELVNIFNYYHYLPRVELCRVGALPDASGQYSHVKYQIAIADSGSTSKKEFKHTLIHEIWHFIDQVTADNVDWFFDELLDYLKGEDVNLEVTKVIPNHLSYSMAAPTTLGWRYTKINNFFTSFMFGYFLYIKDTQSKVTKADDLNKNNITEKINCYYLYEERGKYGLEVKGAKEYLKNIHNKSDILKRLYNTNDHSIISKNFQGIYKSHEKPTKYGGKNPTNVMEDLANIFAEYLLNKNKFLKNKKFEKRARLINWYFNVIKKSL